MKKAAKTQQTRVVIFDKKGIELLAEQIKKIRKSKKISQRQLAFEAGISRSQIERIERAQINPTVSTIFAIAKVLDISPAEFFNFTLPSNP